VIFGAVNAELSLEPGVQDTKDEQVQQDTPFDLVEHPVML
jgi:hypothetical protein